MPEATLLEALDLAQQRDREALRGAGGAPRQAGKPKWLDAGVTEELDDRVRRGDRGSASSEHGLHEGGAIVEEILEREAGALSMESTESDVVARAAGADVARRRCSRRSAPRPSRRPVREQFENDLRALTEAEQDSKELKSAKQHLLYERIVETVAPAVPGRRRTGGDAVVKDSLTKHYVKKAAEAIYKDLVRKKIAVEKRRPDGRSETEIRADHAARSAVSPRTHGSGLFTRGQTQIMSLLTLGTAKEGQRIDDLSLEKDRRFMHHYNFPPYSVGETGRMTGPRRRDIGHGALAQRALEAVIPDAADFPYTIRIVSETLESNGSSSMGSVCGSTLALMDAGVPIKAPVSGIAMGLVKEGDDYVILTDIQGAEDHLGDMDFKVAGTRDGHHRAPDGHQDHGRLARDHGAGARSRRRRPAIAILDRMLAGDRRAAHASSPATRRGSRRSRSTPSTSAW